MFEITSNQVIKIHKGDDSSLFTLFINAGTKFEPIQYKFYPNFSILESPEHLTIYADDKKFNEKVKDDGIFDFEYNYLYDNKSTRIGELGWYLNKEKVDLNDYGIYIKEGSPKIKDHITVAQFVNNPSEVYLYVLNEYDDLDNYIFKKTFISSGEVLTEYNDCRIGTLDELRNVVDKKNNMILNITSEDTIPIRAGNYCYQIKAKLYNFKEDKYTINTITNRLPFYIIDGEDSVIW